MALFDTIREKAGNFYFERNAGRKTYKEMIQSLQEAGDAITERIQYVENRAEHQEKLLHMIGIERWGQQRLRGFLDEPVTMDEYDGYRPEPGMQVKELIEEFKTTRQATIDLVDQMDKFGVMSYEKVPHNDFGEMTSRGWLGYLQTHASFESRGIK